MKNHSIHFLIIVACLMLFARPSFADKREYVWTYQYSILSRGEIEIESYTTFSALDIEHVKGTMSSEHQLEIEVGMTENFDFGIYHVFEQSPNSALHYKGYKLRARYKIGEKGKYLLDPLAYVEYAGKPDFSTHEVELKLILAKEMGRFNFALNPTLEFENEDAQWVTEPKYALALSYGTPSDILRLGIEFKGSDDGHYVGPVISHGREQAWVAFGSAIKLNKIKKGKPELQLRLLMGIGIN